ncbi:hypothetical protein [Kitasatospora sp. DSM 101779]|uniref:hypothetical protein n=1 Tax=Kitasatospora sp. DSM 101779 TaxID=2853165 RepID=UPI0021DA0625|nr:hypothetical protein [Kitasatospora sp. DSM 101779]MCU7821301.1 hypothetical protein [Kitasatospora sp. DSM 101779]
MEFTLPARSLVRTVAGVALALATAAGTTVLVGGAAHAQTVTSGSLSFGGDQGDWISGGESHDFATDAQDRLDVYASSDHRAIGLSVNGAHGNWWSLDLKAPEGKALGVGQYTGATRAPFSGSAEPGLELSGDGRGCNTLTGSFTITDVAFGPNGYVQTLDATFEQHCEGSTAAARGEVRIHNAAPPAELSLGLGVAVDGTASTLNGKAAVHGTVTCNKPASVAVSGQVSQVSHRVLIRGSYSTTVACVPGAPVAWQAKADPTGTTSFQKGDAEVAAQASAVDSDYGTTASAGQSVAVRLAKSAG